MSFYDDASLVFLPSGGAGKDGKAYSIKPVPEYGTNLVTNGGFDTDSDWTKTNATISGGVATITSTGYAYAAVVQNNVLTIGKTYYATIDVNSIVGGLIVGTSETITNSGIAAVTFTATTTYLDIRRDSAFATTTAVIDNVSVREVIVEDGDFTFSRGSNLTATRVDSNGLIEKGRENLLLQSNQFDTTWTTSNASVTSGQSGYDGSSDAWKITSNDTGSSYVRQIITSSGVQTASVYAAKGNVDYIYFRIAGSTNQGAFINLSNGTIDSYLNQGNIIDISVNNVSGDWYRISITFNTTTSDIRFYASDSGGSSSAIGSYIYIQDAQLEQGLVATEYIESGATTGLAGLLEDSPRFDYSGGASCPSLLLEPSRTNLLNYSEYFDGWSASGGIIKTPNATTSTEGVTNAYKIIPPSGTATNVYIYQDAAGDSFSIFAKAREKTKLLIYSGVNGSNAYFDLSSGDVLTTLSDVATADIEEIGTDGWYRCSITWNTTSTRIRVYAVDADNSTNVTGNGSDGLFIYGAQVEQGSYPTSYIPNHSGGSVTREEETARGLFNGDSIFDRDWTAFCELVVPNVGGDLTGAGFVLKSVEGSTSSADRVAVLVHESNSQLELIFYDGTTQQQIPFNYTFGDTLKIAIRNDSAYFINGTKYTTTMVLQEPVEIAYGRAGQSDSSVGETANIKQTLVFPEALSDNNCIALTS